MKKSIFSKKEKKLFSSGFKFALGLFIFFISSLYKNSGELHTSLTLYPQDLIFMIFGAAQAFNFYPIYRHIYNDKFHSNIALFSNFFIYSAFYRMVLLPLSGIGILEYFVIAMLLFSDTIGKFVKTKFPRIGQNPYHILNFGIILFLIRITLFTFMKDNIYNSIRDNGTAKFILVLVGGGAILLMLLQLKSKYFPKKIKMSDNLIVKIDQIITSFFKKVFALISFPVLAIIVLVVILSTSVVGFFIGRQIYDGILTTIEGILTTFNTGKDKIIFTAFYGVMQTISFLIVIFYQFLEYNHIKDLAKGLARKNFNLMKRKYSLIDEDSWDLMETDCLDDPMYILLHKERYNKLFLESQGVKKEAKNTETSENN